MAHAELPKHVWELRNRFPAAKRDRVLWKKIHDLAKDGHGPSVAQAEALIRDSLKNPYNAALHAGALEARRRRKAFLRVQVAGEGQIKGILADLADRAAAACARAEVDGKIAPGRARTLLDRLADLNKAAYAAIGREFAALMRQAADLGVRGAMGKAEAVQNAAGKAPGLAREDADGAGGATAPPAASAQPGASSALRQLGFHLGFTSGLVRVGSVFDKGPVAEGSESPENARRWPFGRLEIDASNKTFRLLESTQKPPQVVPLGVQLSLSDIRVRVRADITEGVRAFFRALAEANPLKQTVRYPVGGSVFQKIFTGALRKAMAANILGGDKPSQRVWDLRDENEVRLRRLVASGIAQGKSAASVSRDIRGLLVQPLTLRGLALAAAAPGRGVYRSAYKNALRLTRTETNRAFIMADVVFAKKKDWKLMWQVSAGARDADECDALHGDVMTPAEFDKKYPLHPQCLCYSVAVPENLDVGGTTED